MKLRYLAGLMIFFVCATAMGMDAEDAARVHFKKDVAAASESMDSAEAAGFFAVPAAGMVDEEALRWLAEEVGIGSKAAHLSALTLLSKRIAGPMPYVVPEFKAIPSSVMCGVLMRDGGFNIFAEWAGLLEGFSAGQKAGMVAKKKLLPEFVASLNMFISRFQDAFDRIVEVNEEKTIDEIFQTADMFPGVECIHNFNELIVGTATAEGFLMVRSTGKEDTKSLTNAGGNDSISKVVPSTKEILIAMKKVVSSYFSEKSLSQRMLSGDKTILNPSVFIPVLLQKMIAESGTGEIPGCGVMFTEEPEGRLTSGPQSTGITFIEASIGNNAGVVNGLVATDSYYVVPGAGGRPFIYPQVKVKTTRMLADGRILENDNAIANAPALSVYAVNALKFFADVLERHYGYSMDVEFLVQDGIVFIVQGRPIVTKSMRKSPSYLDLSRVRTDDMWPSETVVASGSSVRDVTSVRNLMCSPNIQHALDACLDMGAEDEVTAVFIGDPAPSMSHPATVFREMDKTVMCVPRFVEIATAVQAGERVWVDPQQHVVIRDRSTTPRTKVSPSGFESPITVKQGWINYPVGRYMSLLSSDWLQDIGDPVWLLPFNKEVYRPMPVLLDCMKKDFQDRVIIAASQLVYRIRFLSRQALRAAILDEDLQAQWLRVQSAVTMLCNQIVELSIYPDNTPQYMQRLLAIRFLQAVIYQQPENTNFVAGLSLANLVQTTRDERFAYSKIAEDTTLEEGVPAYYVQLDKVHKIALSDEVSRAWEWVLSLAKKNSVVLARLVRVVKELEHHSLLSMWLHTDFMEMVRRAQEVRKPLTSIFNSLRIDYKKLLDDAVFLRELALKKRQIMQMNISAFADADRCEEAWRGFNEGLLAYFINAGFHRRHRESGSYGKIAAVEVLRRFIEQFDRALKGVKGNSAFLLEKRLALFQAMLQGYYRLMHAVIRLVPAGGVEYNGASTLEKYAEMIERIINRSHFTKEDILPTRGVEVFNFSIGSGHDFFYDREKTLQPASGEDAFSIIHQSLLHCCGVLNFTSIGVDFVRPELLAEVERVFSHPVVFSKTKKMTTQLVGCELEYDGMTLHYNMPLGQHSCQLTLNYAHKSRIVTSELHFCGGFAHERSRWCTGTLLAAMFGAGFREEDGCEVSIPVLRDHSFITKLLIKNPSSLGRVSLFWTDLIRIACKLDVSPEGMGLYMRPLEEALEERVFEILQSLEYFGPIGLQAQVALFSLLQPVGPRGAPAIFVEILPAAVQVVGQALGCPDEFVQQEGKKLLQRLMKQGAALDVAFVIGQRDLVSEDKQLRYAAQSLLSDILKHGQGAFVREIAEMAEVHLRMAQAHLSSGKRDLVTWARAALERIRKLVPASGGVGESKVADE